MKANNPAHEFLLHVADLMASLKKEQAKSARLEREAQWLATCLALGERGTVQCPLSENAVLYCGSDRRSCVECWRKAARKAVEAEK